MQFSRDEIVQRLRKVVEEGNLIIAAGAGGGLSARCEEMGGADLILVYNSGRYRMTGRSSLTGILPVGDANQVAIEMVREVLPVVEKTPVLAGVFAHDPFRSMESFINELMSLGVCGVQNAPSFGQWDGRFKYDMDQAGFSFTTEVEMIAYAHTLGMITVPSAWNDDQARQMAKHSDLLVAHLGGTLGGATGFETITLEEAASEVQRIRDAAVSENSDVLVLCHGGPIAEPEDVEFIIKHTEGLAGFQGGSSMERIPVERAITQQVRRFKEIRA